MAVSFETPACFARSFEFGERLFFRRCQLVRRLLSISCGAGGGLAVGVAAFVFRPSDHCSILVSIAVRGKPADPFLSVADDMSGLGSARSVR